MRIRMLRDRDFTPAEDRRVTVAYRAEWAGTVKRAWGEQMVAEGDAVEIGADAPGEDGEPGSPRRGLSAAQVKALDRDGDGRAGGSLPKAAKGSAGE